MGVCGQVSMGDWGPALSWADVVVHPSFLSLRSVPAARRTMYSSPTASFVHRDRRRATGLDAQRGTLPAARRHSRGRRKQMGTDSCPTCGRYDIQADDPRHSERADCTTHGNRGFFACAETDVSDHYPRLLGDASRDELRRRQPTHRVGRPGFRVSVDVVYLPECRGAVVRIGSGPWSDDHAHPTMLPCRRHRLLVRRCGNFRLSVCLVACMRSPSIPFPRLCTRSRRSSRIPV